MLAPPVGATIALMSVLPVISNMSNATGPKLFVSRLMEHWSIPSGVYLCNPDLASVRRAKQLASAIIVGRLDGTTYYRLTPRNVRGLLVQRRPAWRRWVPRMTSSRPFPGFLQRWQDRYLDRGSVWLFKNADAVVFQSALSVRMHERFLGFDCESLKYKVIHNGVDTQEYTPDGSVGRLEGSPALLISASVYRLHKRLQDAIRVTNLLAKYYPRVKLHVIGEPDPLVSRLLAEIDSTRCVFHGRVSPEALPRIYAGADLQLSMSIFDPCPNVVCEGLASGLPVVTPVESGASELIGPENAHWAVHESLTLEHRELHVAEAIPRALEEQYIRVVDELLQKLGHEQAAARSRATDQLDIRDVAARYEAFVGSLVADAERRIGG